MNGDEYTFHIDAYTPDTIPMARLAEYMQALALLLGETAHVHFVRLEPGSTSIVHRIEREAAPKVRLRVETADTEEAPDDARTGFERVNKMLREDDAIGDLVRDNSKVLKFPGRQAPRPEKAGPFTQSAEFDGVLVRIGGKDETAHATIEDADGRSITCEVTRELAREMAHHLFGAPLRVQGRARWIRTEEGQWQLLRFRGERFQVLTDDELRSVITKLRAVKGMSDDAERLALMHDLRGSDDELH